MNVANEILDAIEIIVDKKIRENTAQIYPGVCKSVSDNTCVMSINGRNNTVQFYGSTPTVGTIYRVFVPNGNMSMAFIITGTNDGSGGSSGVTSYTKLTDLPTINGVVLQEGATSKSLSLYGIGNEPNYPVTKVNGKTGEVILTADDVDALPSSTTIVNPNLLDNWYFGNPVNQRGQTSWTNPSNMQYAIDRWQITNSSVVALVNDGITVTAEIQQGLEKNRLELGRTYTFSVLSSDRRLGKHTFVLASDMTTIRVNFGFGIFVCYLSGDNVWLQIYGDGSTYKAAKLELGSQQTLAHRENGVWVLNEIPDYGEQLRRCLRYDYIIGRADDAAPVGMGTAYSDTAVLAVIELPETMRANPAVSITGLVNLRFSESKNISVSSVSNYGFSGDKVQLYFSGLSGLTQGQSCDLYTQRGSKLEFNSNL